MAMPRAVLTKEEAQILEVTKMGIAMAAGRAMACIDEFMKGHLSRDDTLINIGDQLEMACQLVVDSFKGNPMPGMMDKLGVKRFGN